VEKTAVGAGGARYEPVRVVPRERARRTVRNFGKVHRYCVNANDSHRVRSGENERNTVVHVVWYRQWIEGKRASLITLKRMYKCPAARTFVSRNCHRF